MLVIHELEVRQREFFLKQFRQFLLDGLGPFAYENDELVNRPYHTAGQAGIIGTQLSLHIRITDKGAPFLCRLFDHLRSDFFLTHAKETMIGRIVPENAHARHLLIERAHVIHLSSPFFISQLGHWYLWIVRCFLSCRGPPRARFHGHNISHSSPKLPLSKERFPRPVSYPGTPTPGEWVRFIRTIWNYAKLRKRNDAFVIFGIII